MGVEDLIPSYWWKESLSQYVTWGILIGGISHYQGEGLQVGWNLTSGIKLISSIPLVILLIERDKSNLGHPYQVLQGDLELGDVRFGIKISIHQIFLYWVGKLLDTFYQEEVSPINQVKTREVSGIF